MVRIGCITTLICQARAAEPDIQGRLQIRWPKNRFSDRFQKLTVCAKNFEHYPRSEPCDNAPNYELKIEPEIGMLAKGVISTSYTGSRQVDFPFRFKWPGDLSLITWTPDKHHYSGELTSYDGWRLLNMKGPLDGVEVEGRILCAENYYGRQCERYCIPSSSDRSGHYECDQATGSKNCHNGWETTMSDGIECTTPICLTGCLSKRCRQPGECRCDQGFMGAKCNQCKPKPGCKHGTCNNPNECNCQPGYAGTNCDIDLNNMCQNGGSNPVMVNNDYTCTCPDGFTGRHCESRSIPVIPDCGCENGGECRTGGQACVCPLGFYGSRCESVENRSDSLIVGIGLGIGCVIALILLVAVAFGVYQHSRRAGKAAKAPLNESAHSRLEGDLEEQPLSFQSKRAQHNTPVTECSFGKTLETSQSSMNKTTSTSTTMTIEDSDDYATQPLPDTPFIQRAQSTEPPSYKEAINTKTNKKAAHSPQHKNATKH